VLAFVEVKTRSNRNWDADGRLAITPQKQAKLLQAAQLFLAEHPDFANLPCRFDVALVSCQRISQRSQRDCTDLSPSPVVSGKATQVSPIQLGQPIFRAGYRLILQDYIQSAFE
jgi:putative endonuclease